MTEGPFIFTNPRQALGKNLYADAWNISSLHCDRHRLSKGAQRIKLAVTFYNKATKEMRDGGFWRNFEKTLRNQVNPVRKNG